MESKNSDLLGLGKVLPIDKLIEILTKSVGKLSKSYFDKKDVDTKAYEIKKLAEARAEEMKIMADAVKQNFLSTGGIEYNKEGIVISSPTELTTISDNSKVNLELHSRVEERINFQEQKKQLNIESVTAYAVEDLKNESAVTDEPIDEDWGSRFFKIVEDISNEDMQALWGKILSGEIKKPKSYSLRTLELLRNLSSHEAQIFQKIARLAIKRGDKSYLFIGRDEILSKKYHVSYSDRALLTEIGLLQSGTFVNYHLYASETDSDTPFVAGSKIVVIKTKANTPEVLLPVDVFTVSGNELLKLMSPCPPVEYLRDIFHPIKNDNINVVWGDILEISAEYIKHKTPLLDL